MPQGIWPGITQLLTICAWWGRRCREEGVVDASGIDAAIQVLSLDGQAADRHPEKRAKAAFADYYAAELPTLKQEKPGLRLMQVGLGVGNVFTHRRGLARLLPCHG